MTQEPRRRIERKREWKTWRGSMDDLKKTFKIIEDLMRERREAIIKEMRSKNSSIDPDENQVRQEIKQEMRSREIESIETSPLVEVTLEHGDDSVTATNSDILSELDRRTITAVTFTGQFPIGYTTERLRVHLPWRNHFPPVSTHIISSDHGWANKSLAMLTEEFDRRRTWWWRLHTPTGRGLFAGLAILLINSGLGVIIRGYAPRLSDIQFIVTTLIIDVAVAIVAITCINNSKIYLALFPKVELSEDDGFSRGGKSLSAIGSVLFTILIGIIVNKLS